MKLSGVFVATISPFDREGNLSLSRLREHLEFLAKSGVSGFVVCGTTGEGPTLTREERRAEIEIAREIAVQYNLKTIAGCGTNNTATTLEQMQEAEKLGCEAALVVTPYYNKPTQSGLIAHYEYLADRSSLPLLLYNIPGRTSVNLEVDTIIRLFGHKRIVGIKEASGSHAQWSSLATRGDLRTKALLSGDDDAYATIMALGGAGIISATANVIPSVFVDIQKSVESGDLADAFATQKKILPMVRAMFSETNPAPIKYALHRLKGYENSLRLPLVPVQKNTESTIVEVMNKLEIVRNS